MRKHTVTVVRLSDLSTKTFKAVRVHKGQRDVTMWDEWGTRSSWPLSKYIVRTH